jgi:hypothetical protein
MRTTIMLSLLAIAPAVLAQKPAEDAEATVRAYVVKNVDDRSLNVLWAQRIASQILAGAGVHIKWQLGAPRLDKYSLPIIIDLTSDTPKTFAPHSLAYAQVYEGVHIRVFWDRIQNTVSRANPLATFLLAHVMAHEITHILEGLEHHSQTGLMKAGWTQREIQGMSVHPLSLAPEDVQLIHDGLPKWGLRVDRSGHTTDLRIRFPLQQDRHL